MPPNEGNGSPGPDFSRNSYNSNDCSNALRQSAYGGYGAPRERVGPLKALGRFFLGRHDGGQQQMQYMPPQQFRPIQYQPVQYQPLEAGFSLGTALRDGSILYNTPQGQTYYRPSDGSRCDVASNDKKIVEQFTAGPDKGFTRIKSADLKNIYERAGEKNTQTGWKEWWKEAVLDEQSKPRFDQNGQQITKEKASAVHTYENGKHIEVTTFPAERPEDKIEETRIDGVSVKVTKGGKLVEVKEEKEEPVSVPPPPPKPGVINDPTEAESKPKTEPVKVAEANKTPALQDKVKEAEAKLKEIETLLPQLMAQLKEAKAGVHAATTELVKAREEEAKAKVAPAKVEAAKVEPTKVEPPPKSSEPKQEKETSTTGLPADVQQAIDFISSEQDRKQVQDWMNAFSKGAFASLAESLPNSSKRISVAAGEAVTAILAGRDIGLIYNERPQNGIAEIYLNWRDSKEPSGLSNKALRISYQTENGKAPVAKVEAVTMPPPDEFQAKIKAGVDPIAEKPSIAEADLKPIKETLLRNLSQPPKTPPIQHEAVNSAAPPPPPPGDGASSAVPPPAPGDGMKSAAPSPLASGVQTRRARGLVPPADANAGPKPGSDVPPTPPAPGTDLGPKPGSDVPPTPPAPGANAEQRPRSDAPPAQDVRFSKPEVVNATNKLEYFWNTLADKPVENRNRGLDPAASGLMGSLDTWLRRASALRVKAIEKTPSGDWRDNLETLRLEGTNRRSNMTEAMYEFDMAALAVGRRNSARPTGTNNRELAQLEVQRLSDRTNGYLKGRTPDPDKLQPLNTMIFENLRPKFSIEKPWRGTDEEIEFAAFKADGPEVESHKGIDYRLNLNKNDYKNDIERLYKRFVVASVFAKIKEDPNRPFFAITEQVKLNRFVLDHWEKKLDIVDRSKDPTLTVVPWKENGPEAERIAKEWGVTKREAVLMQARVQFIKDHQPEMQKKLEALLNNAQ